MSNYRSELLHRLIWEMWQHISHSALFEKLLRLELLSIDHYQFEHHIWVNFLSTMIIDQPLRGICSQLEKLQIIVVDVPRWLYVQQSTITVWWNLWPKLNHLRWKRFDHFRNCKTTLTPFDRSVTCPANHLAGIWLARLPELEQQRKNHNDFKFRVNQIQR